MKTQRRRSNQTQGLFAYSSPPSEVVPHPSVIRQWLRGGDVDKLESVVLQGLGHKLLGEYAADLKVRAFLKTVPSYLARIDMLHEAAVKGHLGDLQTLLRPSGDGVFTRKKLSALALSKDPSGSGLLHKAVFYGHRDMTKWLVAHHANTVHVRDREGRTPLHYCGRAPDPEWTWTILRQAGADPNLLDSRGRPPQYYMDHPEDAELPSSPSDVPSGRFTSGNNGLVVKPSNIRIWIHDRDLGRLAQVVWEGHGDKLRTETSQHGQVKTFLSAVPYIMGVVKDTHTAAVNNDTILLRKRTEPPVPHQILMAKDQNGLTPLHKAAGLGHAEMVRALLTACPEAVGVLDREGRAPLHYAAVARGSGTTYDLLLEYGADENTMDKKGKSPSYYINNAKEIDLKQLTVIPEATRTSAVFPANWDWSSLRLDWLSPRVSKPPPPPNNGDSAFEDETPERNSSQGIEINNNSVKELPTRPQTYDIDAEADEGVEEEEGDDKERGYIADSDGEGHYEAEYEEVDPDYEVMNEPDRRKEEESPEQEESLEKNEDTEGENVKDIVEEKKKSGMTGDQSSIYKIGKNVVEPGLATIVKGVEEAKKNVAQGKNKINSQLKNRSESLKRGFKSSGNAIEGVEKNINKMIYNIDKTLKNDIDATKSFLEREQNKVKEDVKKSKNSSLTKGMKNKVEQINNQFSNVVKESITKTTDRIKKEKDNINKKIEHTLGNVANNIHNTSEKVENAIDPVTNKVHNKVVQTKLDVDKKLGPMTDRINITKDFIVHERQYSALNVKAESPNKYNKIKDRLGKNSKLSKDNNHKLQSEDVLIKKSNNVNKNKKTRTKVKDTLKTSKTNKYQKLNEDENQYIEKYSSTSASGNSASTTLAENNAPKETKERRFTVYRPVQKHWEKLSEYAKSSTLEESRKTVEELRRVIPNLNMKYLRNGRETSADRETRLRKVVDVGNMEQLAEVVLAGDGELLAKHRSSNPDVQLFIENIPTYMRKIDKVHTATREGNLRELQAALDRRKFAVARESNSTLRLSPLHVAVLYGRTAVVRFLASRFPETMKVGDTKGRTPVHFAASLRDNGHYYNLLADLGGDIAMEDHKRKTPEFYLEHPEHTTHEQLLAEFEGRKMTEDSQSSEKGLEQSVVAVSGFPLFGQEEGQYLASSLGRPLIAGLTEVASRRPTDPVRYLANYLQNYEDLPNSPPRRVEENNTRQNERPLPALPLPVPVNSPPSPNPSTPAHSPPPNPIKPSSSLPLPNPPAPEAYSSSNNPTETSEHQVVGSEEKLEEETGRKTPEPPPSTFKPVQRDEFGQMILHFAMARTHGRNAVLQMLQEVDCNIALRDELYRTPRDVALQVSLVDNVEAIDRYVVSLAATGQVEKLRELLVEGYDHILDTHDDQASIVEISNERSQTQVLAFLDTIVSFEDRRERLHRAIRLASDSQVHEMLKNNPGLALAKNSYSRCSLHVAVLNQHDHIVHHIASHYPQTLAIGDNLLRTPLHYAMGVERVETMSKILIQAGATRVVKDLKGRQPSYYFMNKSDIQKLQDEEDMLRV